MAAGPQEARLNQAVAGAERLTLFLAQAEWRGGADRLEDVADDLDTAAPVMLSDFGGDTGTTAQAAFRKVAEKSRERAAQMRTASEAIGRARDALVQAEVVQQELASAPLGDRPTFTPSPPGGNDVEDIKRYRAHTDQLNAYNAAAADREARAKAAVDHLDEVYARSTADMRAVHGEPDSRSGTSSGAAASGGARTASGGAASTAAGPAAAPGTSVGPSGDVGPASTPGHAAGPAPAAHSAPLGVPQGPSPLSAGTGPAPAPAPVATGSGATSPGNLGGLAGAVGGGLIGGAAGVGGAVRGGAAAASPRPATSATPGRAIGSSARTGASGALGRAAATTTSPTTRAAGSAGVTRAAGTTQAGSGRAATTRAYATGGAAGSRGQTAGGASTGATGRANAAEDKDRRRRNEPFEDEQDWTDDEGITPGVID